MKIPPAAIAAPQVTTSQAVPGRGFAQALFAAGLTDPVSSLPSPFPSPLPGNSLLSTASNRNPKNAKQPPAKEASKDTSKRTIVASVTTSLQATLSPPLRILPFSRETESHAADSSVVKEVTVPSETPATPPVLNATSDAHAEKQQTPASQSVNVDSFREVPKPPAPENQPAAPSGDMAFAARVQPALAPSPQPPVSPRPLQHDTAVPEPVKKSSDKDLTADTPVVQPIAAGADASLSSQGQHAQYSSPEMASTPPSVTTSEPPAPPAPPHPVEVKAPDTQPKAAATPLKDLSVQVAQQGNQKVEVRMVQQSGELHVSVRTGDSDLAHGLQQGLPDLVGRLQENGFRAEAWRPGGGSVQSGPELDARNSPGNSHNGESQSNSGGSHQQQGERRQNQSQRPAWVEELENTLATGAKSQGATYGIGS